MLALSATAFYKVQLEFISEVLDITVVKEQKHPPTPILRRSNSQQKAEVQSPPPHPSITLVNRQHSR